MFRNLKKEKKLTTELVDRGINMTVQEAADVLLEKYPDYSIFSYRQMDNQYIFEAYPPKVAQFVGVNMDLDPYYAVHAKTGKITNFLPVGENKKFFSVKPILYNEM